MSMTEDLFIPLIEKPHRETSGATTAARFDYQKNWAFCELIARHEADLDYLVAFEFHDDVVFFDKEINPEKIEFIQVKTSKQVDSITLPFITSRQKDANSIIGKMLKNAEGLVATQNMRFILVSNKAFKFSADNICAKDLNEKDKEQLLLKIQEEFSDFVEDDLDSLFFWVFGIPVDDIEDFLYGKALKLFDKEFGAEVSYNVPNWLRGIQGEIARRNNVSPDKITNVEQLISKKCIGKSLIDKTLNNIRKKYENKIDIISITRSLSESGWSDILLMRLNKKLTPATVDFNNPTNTECNTLHKNIKNILKKHTTDSMGIADILDTVFENMTASNLLPKPYQDKEYICALTLLVINETL